MNGCWIIKSFSHQNFALKNIWHCIFYGYNLLTWVSQGLSHWSTFVLFWITRMHLKTRSYNLSIWAIIKPIINQLSNQSSLANLRAVLYRRNQHAETCERVGVIKLLIEMVCCQKLANSSTWNRCHAQRTTIELRYIGVMLIISQPSWPSESTW